jgi:hypothetical protein
MPKNPGRLHKKSDGIFSVFLYLRIKSDPMRKYTTLYICILFLFLIPDLRIYAQNPQFRMPAGCSQNDYIPQTIIYKLKPSTLKSGELTPAAASRLNAAFSSIGALHTARLFPNHKAPLAKTNQTGQAVVDLSLIYECEYQSVLTLETAINELLSTGLLEYAQPRYINYPWAYTPNDPFNLYQYQLPTMHLPQAWEIEKGDTNIVIGITDWGLELTHPDLSGNIKYNHEDPIDGIDNDNDGYVDNYYGWDMGCNDNDPTGVIIHGTYVSGCSSATTDNGTGVSGSGFKCKFIHVKVADANNFGSRCYESVVYAADHGCSVINCSWGSTFYQGQYGQDVMNYAVINRDAVVVAAAGNNSNDLWVYPASYDNVLSVGGTRKGDTIWAGSTYGYQVDLFAPGQGVWTTSPGGSYDWSSGTSFASPLVAGVAGLLRSHFPSLNALQIDAQLRAGCDNIDTVPFNIPYAGKLGSGRVNAYRSLSDSNMSFIEMRSPVFTDSDHDQLFEPTDTVYLRGTFINYLAPAQPDCKVTLTSLSGYVSVIDSVFSPGALGTLSTTDNYSAPFSFRLLPTIPPGSTVTLKLTTDNNSQRSYQYLQINANIDYLTIDTNHLALTITSTGMLGYNHGLASQGIGLTYKNSLSVIDTSGFIAGTSVSQISDVLPGIDHVLHRDFVSLDQVKQLQGSPVADFMTHGTFSDSVAGPNHMNLRVDHYAMASDQPGMEDFIILVYVLHNDSSGTLTDLHAGLYLDWEINNNLQNIAAWDNSRKLSYAYSLDESLYAGIRLLSPWDYFHYAFDNNGFDGSILIADGFSDLEKWVTLVSNRSDAGNVAGGNDISAMVSYGPFQLAPGDSVELGFALVAADNLPDLLQFSDHAQDAWEALSGIGNVTTGGEAIRVTPNPCHDYVDISGRMNPSETVLIRICDQTGRVVCEKSTVCSNDGQFTTTMAVNRLEPGMYFVKLIGFKSQFTKKLLKL